LRAHLRLIAFSACALTLALQFYLWPHVSDDAYISFRYIHRLLEGQGLTFNDGERVEGFSHPLWIFLVAGCAWITGLSIPDAARGLGLLFSLGTIGSLFASRRALASEAPAAAIVLLAAFPGFHVYATSGLETPLLMFLLTMGTVASLGQRDPTTLSSLSFGFASITRPEGLLYGLFWLGRRVRAVQKVAILLAPFAAYELLRVAYFDAWLPNAFRAKLPGTWGTFFGLQYLGHAALALAWPVLLRAASEDFSKVFRAAFGPLLAGVVFVLYAWGDWMPFSRFLAPLWPIASLLVASAHPKRIAAVTALVAATTLGTYWPQTERYLRNEGMDNMLMRGEDTLAVGTWLSKTVKPGSTVRTARLGGMSFAAPKLTFWDENGLTDRAQAIWISEGRPGGLPSSPVRARVPDVVAALLVPEKWSYTEDEAQLAWLESKYSLAARFPQGTFGEVHVWISKSVEVRRSSGVRRGGALDLPLHLIEIAAHGVARAGADEGPQEQSLEAGHPVVARSRDGDEGCAARAPPVVVHEKAQLERGVEVVARVELLDRDRVPDAGWGRAPPQGIDGDVVHPDGLLEAEIDHRPVEEVFGAGETAVRVFLKIREELGHGNGKRVAAFEDRTELLGHGQGLLAIVETTERGVPLPLVRAHEIQNHLAGNVVGLPRRVRRRPVHFVPESAHRRCRELHAAVARMTPAKRDEVRSRERQRPQILESRRAAEARDLRDAGPPLESHDIAEPLDERL